MLEQLVYGLSHVLSTNKKCASVFVAHKNGFKQIWLQMHTHVCTHTPTCAHTTYTWVSAHTHTHTHTSNTHNMHTTHIYVYT